jgi:hypothetical protein
MFCFRSMMAKKQKAKEDIWDQIKEWQKDPDFIRAAYEFVRHHTGRSP